MNRRLLLTAIIPLALGGCKKVSQNIPAIKTFGTAITVVSGERQVAGAGGLLEQPVVIQVNDEKGNGLSGALVELSGSGGMNFNPATGITGGDGQFSTNVQLGSMPGRYQIRAITRDRSGKPLDVKIEEIALGYQQTLGRELSDKYCSRCHDPESTPERVSNHDNLSKPPHAFTDGAILNAVSGANLAAIIKHGGAALGKSPEMPLYGNTLANSEVEALIAYMRAVADPPYRQEGVYYANK